MLLRTCFRAYCHFYQFEIITVTIREELIGAVEDLAARKIDLVLSEAPITSSLNLRALAILGENSVVFAHRERYSGQAESSAAHVDEGAQSIRQVAAVGMIKAEPRRRWHPVIQYRDEVTTPQVASYARLPHL
jgi:hypothetical protein